MHAPVQCAVVLNESMSDAAAEPAPKLQKRATGDVAAALTPQAAVPGVTPGQPAETAGTAAIVAPPLQKANATQMEGGKKRKVALYISYIGAGYHVSATTQFHILQRMHAMCDVGQAIRHGHYQPYFSLACLIARPPPCSFTQGMQRNPGYPSIEGELEKAICKAGGISEANADSFTKVRAFLYNKCCHQKTVH